MEKEIILEPKKDNGPKITLRRHEFKLQEGNALAAAERVGVFFDEVLSGKISEEMLGWSADAIGDCVARLNFKAKDVDETIHGGAIASLEKFNEKFKRGKEDLLSADDIRLLRKMHDLATKIEDRRKKRLAQKLFPERYPEHLFNRDLEAKK